MEMEKDKELMLEECSFFLLLHRRIKYFINLEIINPLPGQEHGDFFVELH